MQLASFLVIAFWKIYSTSFRNGNLFMLIKNLAFRIKRSRMFSIHRCDICAKRIASRTMYREDSAVDSFHLMQALLHKRKANISRLTVSIRKHFCLRVRLEADFYLKSWKNASHFYLLVFTGTLSPVHYFAIRSAVVVHLRRAQAFACSTLNRWVAKTRLGAGRMAALEIDIDWFYSRAVKKRKIPTLTHTHTYIIIAGKRSEMRREAFASNHPNIVRNCLSRCSL